MSHPSRPELALFAGGDLAWRDTLALRWHLSRCSECATEVESFRAVRAAAAEQIVGRPDLTGINWERRAAEMRANIRLGLEAGEIVARRTEAPEPLGWRSAVLVASLSLVVVTGWFLSRPDRFSPQLRSESGGVVLEANHAGLAVREGGRSLTLMHPNTGIVLQQASGPGALRARYVDSQTGQVTITHVYAGDE